MRDTIARQSDVDKDSMKYEVEPGTKKYRIGTITFFAKKGKSINLEKLYEDIRATRLSGKTNSAVNYLEITAEGKAVEAGKEILLKVAGTTQEFALADDPQAKPKEGTKTPFQRLRDALANGEIAVSVTGRVRGWNDKWPAVLKEFPGEPAKDAKDPDRPAAKRRSVLIVTEFQTSKE